MTLAPTRDGLSKALALAAFTVAVALPALSTRAADSISADRPAVQNVQVAAVNRCVRIGGRLNRQVLVNTCGECRIVKVRRTRRGNDFPTLRTYNIPKRSNFDLDFKGPGRSQILADLPCEGGTQTAEAPQCVRLIQPTGRKPVLLNQCGSCRIVGVETPATAGGGARQTYTLKAKSYIPTPWLKPNQSRVTFERPCG